MDGGVGGSVGGWMEGWVDGWTDRRTDSLGGWVDGRRDVLYQGYQCYPDIREQTCFLTLSALRLQLVIAYGPRLQVILKNAPYTLIKRVNAIIGNLKETTISLET